MSTEIYYFSGTGNSLHVAKELQARLPDADLIPILGLAGQDSVATHADTVGFVFPHYASTLPKIVYQFIERLELDRTGYLFAIATRGRTRTMAFVELDEILKEKGRRLDSHFVLTMPSGSAPLVKGYADQITKQRIDELESAVLARLDSIQRIVFNQEISRDEDKGAMPPPPFLRPLIPLIQAATPLLISLGKKVETSFSFTCDASCTGCGVCEQVCLTEKVRMVDARPMWQAKVDCLGCFACLNFCPEESIQVESKWYLRSHTDQNGRYHHPEIAANEIAAQKGHR